MSNLKKMQITTSPPRRGLKALLAIGIALSCTDGASGLRMIRSEGNQANAKNAKKQVNIEMGNLLPDLEAGENGFVVIDDPEEVKNLMDYSSQQGGGGKLDFAAQLWNEMWRKGYSITAGLKGGYSITAKAVEKGSQLVYSKFRKPETSGKNEVEMIDMGHEIVDEIVEQEPVVEVEKDKEAVDEKIQLDNEDNETVDTTVVVQHKNEGKKSKGSFLTRYLPGGISGLKVFASDKIFGEKSDLKEKSSEGRSSFQGENQMQEKKGTKNYKVIELKDLSEKEGKRPIKQIIITIEPSMAAKIYSKLPAFSHPLTYFKPNFVGTYSNDGFVDHVDTDSSFELNEEHQHGGLNDEGRSEQSHSSPTIEEDLLETQVFEKVSKGEVEKKEDEKVVKVKETEFY